MYVPICLCVQIPRSPHPRYVTLNTLPKFSLYFLLINIMKDNNYVCLIGLLRGLNNRNVLGRQSVFDKCLLLLTIVKYVLLW